MLCPQSTKGKYENNLQSALTVDEKSDTNKAFQVIVTARELVQILPPATSEVGHGLI
jgi:hypothetical protein